jgi:probable DNA metabolism protein
MSYRTDVAYSYDGSFDGFLCCVFESYDKKELPFDIQPDDAPQGFLFEGKPIQTDSVKADRVYRSIPLKICPEAQELVRMGWLTCVPHKELLLLRFLRLGFTHGRKIMDMLADDTVNSLNSAVMHLNREGHHYLGFVRFSIHKGVLVAVIEPKNQVLPVISEHFCDRFHTETFMIFDKTHGLALIHRPGQSGIIALDELTVPEADAEEEEYRRLWKRFYDSIGIEGRYNPRLRMNHMPKRYWSQLPEMQDATAYASPVEKRISRAAESTELLYQVRTDGEKASERSSKDSPAACSASGISPKQSE